MRVCVIGAGIAGLSAAHHLSRHPGADITVIEAQPHGGGRADVADGGEHCPRIFLDDYRELFALLREVPSADGRTVHSDLRRVVRYCRSRRRGWVAISHLYRFRSPEITWRDRFDFLQARTRTPLVADVAPGPNTNRYGSVRNYTFSSAVWVIKNLLRSEYGYAFDRPTDQAMIEPWMRFLEARGVRFELGARVARVEVRDAGAVVTWGRHVEQFDAVVASAYLPDLISILPTTDLARARVALPHTHCTCVTIQLDPREPVVRRDECAVYSQDGLSALIQPRAARAVVMCLRSPSTDPDWVVAAATALLDLEYAPLEVAVRLNSAPGEGVWTAEHLTPADVLAAAGPVYLAGSYLRTSYPLDSAECAARSARDAVGRLIDRLPSRLTNHPEGVAVHRREQVDCK